MYIHVHFMWFRYIPGCILHVYTLLIRKKILCAISYIHTDRGRCRCRKCVLV